MPAKFEPNWRDWALSDRFKSVLFVITVRLLIKPSSETAFMRGNPLFLLSSAVADWYFFSKALCKIVISSLNLSPIYCEAFFLFRVFKIPEPLSHIAKQTLSDSYRIPIIQFLCPVCLFACSIEFGQISWMIL